MSIVKGIKSVQLLDDGTICGTVEQLIADFDKIVAEGLKLVSSLMFASATFVESAVAPQCTRRSVST